MEDLILNVLGAGLGMAVVIAIVWYGVVRRWGHLEAV